VALEVGIDGAAELGVMAGGVELGLTGNKKLCKADVEAEGLGRLDAAELGTAGGVELGETDAAVLEGTGVTALDGATLAELDGIGAAGGPGFEDEGAAELIGVVPTECGGATG
jgi:hypothetical protein